MRPLRLFLCSLLAVASLAACKDGVLEPERFGTVQGRVLDRETSEPVAGASVTTSPATGAFITGDDGTFSVGDVLTGSYTISANRRGYAPNTVTVGVREGQTTNAEFFLNPADDGGDGDGDPDLDFAAELLNFTPEVFQGRNGSDSTYVIIEYRAVNRGDVDIAAYEIYFRVDTDRGPFYQEVRGSDLLADQQDFGTVRKYLVGAMPTAVVIEDTATTKASGNP